MKEVMAIVRINMMNKTKKALADAGISSSPPGTHWAGEKAWSTARCSKGAEKGYEEAIAQLGHCQRLIPKRIIFVVVPDKPGAKDGEDDHRG